MPPSSIFNVLGIENSAWAASQRFLVSIVVGFAVCRYVIRLKRFELTGWPRIMAFGILGIAGGEVVSSMWWAIGRTAEYLELEPTATWMRNHSWMLWIAYAFMCVGASFHLKGDLVKWFGRKDWFYGAMTICFAIFFIFYTSLILIKKFI